MANNPGRSAGRRPNAAVMASVIGGLALVVAASVYFGMHWLASRAPGDDTQTVVQHTTIVHREHAAAFTSPAPLVANVAGAGHALATSSATAIGKLTPPAATTANAKPGAPATVASPMPNANALLAAKAAAAKTPATANTTPNAKPGTVATLAPNAKPGAVASPTPNANAKMAPNAKTMPNAMAGRTAVAANANPHAVPVAGPATRLTPVAAMAAKAPAAPAAGAPSGKTALHVASTAGTGGPVVSAVTSQAPRMTPEMAHLDEHTTYQYNALGRRDPFQSLVSGEFVGDDVGGDAPPDMGGIKVVGIMWGATDQFAMVEDARGNSYVLRKGDKVQNGVVTGLKRDAVIVNITTDGQSQEVTIPLTRKGDQNAH